MRIIIIGINYWPEVTGIGVFTAYRAEYLAAAGHDVTVCTTFPYYPEWRVHRKYARRIALSEKRNGVKIVRSYIYIPKHVIPIKRIVHEVSFFISVTLSALTQKRPDVLMIVSPPLGLAATGIILSRLWRIPYIFDVEDLQPDAAGDLGMLPVWAVKLLYRVEAAAYHFAWLVTTLTPEMKRKIINKGISENKVKLIEPCMDDSLVKLSLDEGCKFKQRYNIYNNFIVTYSGNMGVKQGLDVVLNAAALNSFDDSILFLMVGDGVDRLRLLRNAANLNLHNVRFLPLLNLVDFRGLLAASDVCLILQQASASEVAFPSKMVTYLAAGRPIVASVNPSSVVARLIRESGAGKAVQAEDPKALLNAIYEFKNNNLYILGELARHYADSHWLQSRVLRNFEQLITQFTEPTEHGL
jgi:colanic acid biosynthesis glycosyl transferase WcaI